MALTRAQTKAIKEKLKGLGFDSDTLKQLTDAELENFYQQMMKTVVEIHIEVDDSHLLSDADYQQIVEDAGSAIKGARTLKEVLLLVASAGKAYLRYQTAGIAG